MKQIFVIIFSVFFLVSFLPYEAHSQVSFNGSGAGGGAVIVGASTTTCDPTIAGAMRYSSGSSCIEVCNGISWGCAANSSCDNAPAFFNFTDQNNLSLSTQYASDIVAITGMAAACSAIVGVSGNGAPEYRICSAPDCSSVDVNWTSANSALAMQGKYIQLRATTAAAAGTTYTVTISVGGITSDWDISTISADCSLSPIGTVCPDGSVYAGTTPDGNLPMYVTRCDYNMVWDGASCTNARVALNWNNGQFDWVETTLINCGSAFACDPSGETNTTTLAAADSDSNDAGTQPHAAAKYCDELVMHGQSDWYLPSALELDVLQKNQVAIGNFGAGQYWSSSEYYYEQAWYEDFSNGLSTTHYKSTAFYVRCARK